MDGGFGAVSKASLMERRTYLVTLSRGDGSNPVGTLSFWCFSAQDAVDAARMEYPDFLVAQVAVLDSSWS